MSTTLHSALTRLGQRIAERRALHPPGPTEPRPGRYPVLAAEERSGLDGPGLDGPGLDGPGLEQPGLFIDHPARHRPLRENMPVGLSAQDRRILYTGPQLSADDQTVFRWLLKLYRARPREEAIQFSVPGLLRSMGWGTGHTDRQRLQQCLLRLQSGTLLMVDPAGKTRKNRSLIERAEWQTTPGGRSGRWQVWISPAVEALFRSSTGR